jgi:hypothetical protein
MVKRKIQNKTQILYEQKALSPIVDPIFDLSTDPIVDLSIDPIIDIQDVYVPKPILEEVVKIDTPTDTDICDFKVKEKAVVKRVVLNKFRLEKDDQLNITDYHTNVSILYYYTYAYRYMIRY